MKKEFVLLMFMFVSVLSFSQNNLELTSSNKSDSTINSNVCDDLKHDVNQEVSVKFNRNGMEQFVKKNITEENKKLNFNYPMMNGSGEKKKFPMMLIMGVMMVGMMGFFMMNRH